MTTINIISINEAQIPSAELTKQIEEMVEHINAYLKAEWCKVCHNVDPSVTITFDAGHSGAALDHIFKAMNDGPEWQVLRDKNKITIYDRVKHQAALKLSSGYNRD
jgi:hypothetical protein